MAVGLYALDIGKAIAIRGVILEAASASVSTLTWYDLSTPQGAAGGRVLMPTQGGGAGLINVSVEGVFAGTVTIYVSNAATAPPTSPIGRYNILGAAVDGPNSFNVERPWRWIAAGFARTSGTVDVVDVYGILGRP